MKKMFSLALALIMALALCVPAFATATEDKTALTITSTNNPDATYEGYRLMGLTSSDSKCTKKADPDHVCDANDCFIYSYKVNDKYTQILKDELGITAAETGKTIDQTIMDAIAEFDTAAEIRSFAESVLNRIIAAQEAEKDAADKKYGADANLTSGIKAELQQGYWLIVDVTVDANVEEGVTRSLVMLDTAGQPALNITAKDDKELLEKTVNDPDAFIGQTVNYTLDYTLPHNLYLYDTYDFVVTDTLSAGLTLDRSSIVVKINDVTVDSSNYELTGSGNTFTIDMGDYILANKNAFFTFPVEITYSAVVNDDAVIAGEGNDNTATLTYTNDPSKNTTGTTSDGAVVSTYAIALKKVNVDGQPLADATFQFPFYVKKDADTDGAYIYAGTTAGTDLTNELTTPASGEITIKGVASGTYTITETKAPDGYNKLADSFTVTATQLTGTSTTTTTYLDEDGNITEEVTETVVTYQNANIAADSVVVVNKTGSELPETGGIGTTIFYTVGGVMMAAAVVLFVTKKKLAVQE